MNCTFSEPIQLDVKEWEYSRMVCTPEAITPTGASFQVVKSYTFGEMATICLLIAIAGLMVYNTVKGAFRKPITYHK